MRAFASSFHAWKMLERQEGIKVPHGLVFPLAVVEAIGAPHGLDLTAEEHHPDGPAGFDAIFLSVLDSRCLIGAARHFRSWQIPFRSTDRNGGRWPLVWAGGQGLHNPLPLAPVADLIVIGDAEPTLPALLDLWHTHGNTARFLAGAAAVPGVFVPSVHDPAVDVIDQAVAEDITVTLDNPISVSHNGNRRIEIARGCKYKCTFCSLGWRAPHRENTADTVIDAIRRSPRTVHLQAGDAESHSGIGAIRQALADHGGFDTGWTGRLDTLLENPDQTTPGNKRYAFGVEGISYRLRRAVGKPYLTDQRLIDDTVTFFATLDPDTRGRAAWHIISGLPTEQPGEVLDLDRVVRGIDDAQTGRGRRNLSLHWQPFQPLPGTPMQWCAAGTGARRHISMLSGLRRLPWVGVRHIGGRTDHMAHLCTILSRSDQRGADLLEALADGRPTIAAAEHITGTTAGHLPPDQPLPWDFITQRWGKDRLAGAHQIMHNRLEEQP